MSDDVSDVQDERRTTDPARRRVRPRTRTASETRATRRRWLMWTLTAGALALIVNTIVGDNGYLSNIRARREQATLEHTVARLRLENQALQLESRRLRDDPRALEETARRTLGFVRPGETLIILRDARPAQPARPQE